MSTYGDGTYGDGTYGDSGGASVDINVSADLATLNVTGLDAIVRLQYRTVVLADSPWIYYEFTNNVTDTQGRANLTNSGGTYGVSGVFGQNSSGNAYSLNGTSQYGSSTDTDLGVALDDNDALSMSCWIGPTSVTGNRTIFRKGSDGSGVMFRLAGTAIEVLIPGVGSWSGGTVANSAWSHVGFSYDGSADTIAIYHNGVQVYSANTTGTFSNSNTDAAAVGRAGNFSSEYFSGYIDELAIFRSALGADRFLEQYIAGGGTPPIAIYPPASNTTVAGLDATITAEDNIYDVTVTADLAGTINVGGQAATVTTTFAITVSADAGTISITDFDATVTAGGSVNIGADLATLTVAGLDATVVVATDVSISAPVTTLTLTGLSAEPLMASTVTYTEDFTDLTLETWITQTGGSINSGRLVTWSDGSPTWVQVSVTIPSSFIGTVTATFRTYSLTSEPFSADIATATWNGGTPTTHPGGYVTDTRTGLIPGNTYTYRMTADDNTPSIVLDSTMAGFDYVTLSGVAVIGNANIEVDPTNIAVAGPDPSVVLGFGPSIVPDVTNIAVESIMPNLLFNGGPIILASTPDIGVLGKDPSLDLVRVVLQETDFATITVRGLETSVRVGDDAGIFIPSSYTGFTARDADMFIGYDLGSLLYGQRKTFSFRLGNTSDETKNFTITATGNLGEMVEFSMDKVTYSPSLLISQLPGNGVSDSIWVRLNVSSTSYLSASSFLINVEQSDA